MSEERALLNGLLTERPDDKGRFDEVFGGPVYLHFEMMDDGCLWIAFYKNDAVEMKERVTIWVRAEKGRKLSVRLYDGE